MTLLPSFCALLNYDDQDPVICQQRKMLFPMAGYAHAKVGVHLMSALTRELRLFVEAYQVSSSVSNQPVI